jgi:lipopolysaccharide/colanic/teichoic acid biosynthesis glycosyltransferase
VGRVSPDAMESGAVASSDRGGATVVARTMVVDPGRPTLQPVPVVRKGQRAKRALDLVLAVVGLVVTAPLWALTAAAIKLGDGGTILYKQRRWGLGGSWFTLHKFRTMRTDSDVTFGIVQATEDDPRVTPVGRFLRATGMDELPQLLNIAKGEMSFVGPRALAVGEAVIEDGAAIRYEDLPGFAERLAVRPGLTGSATIYVPKDAAPRVKFAHDLEYIAHRSLLLDVKLILLSVVISLRGRWDTRSNKL